MSDSLQNQIKDELIIRTAEKVSEKAVDKTIEVIVGFLGRKKSIELSFSLFYRLYNQPPYLETVTQFDQKITGYLMRGSREIVEYNDRKYQATLAVREVTDLVAPFIANPSDELDDEQILSSGLRASSAVVYLTPLIEGALKPEQLGSLMTDTLKFSKELRTKLEHEYVPITKDILFCKLTVYSPQMTELMDELRKVIPTVEASVEGDDKRSVTVLLTDTPIIETLVEALKRAL